MNELFVTKAITPFSSDPVAGPADEAGIHVVQFGLLGGAVLDVCVLDAFVHAGVFPILVVLVFVELVGVVGGLPMMTEILRLFWRRMRSQVLGFQFKDMPYWLSVLVNSMIVQRVHKADVFKWHILAHLLAVGVLDVEIGDIVGQDRHFIAVDFVLVFVGELLLRNILDQFGDVCACACGRVKNSTSLSANGRQSACSPDSRRLRS